MCLTPCWSLKTLVYLILALTRFICASNHCQVSCLSPWRKVCICIHHGDAGDRGCEGWEDTGPAVAFAIWHPALVAWWRWRAGSPIHNWCDGGSHFTFLSLSFPICQWGQPGALPSWPDSDSSWHEGQESTLSVIRVMVTGLKTSCWWSLQKLSPPKQCRSHTNE